MEFSKRISSVIVGLLSIGALASCNPLEPGQILGGGNAPADGGLVDCSQKDAPKTIGSETLMAFSLDFRQNYSGRVSESRNPFPAGFYRLKAERRGEAAYFSLRCEREGTVLPVIIEKELPLTALDDLRLFLKEKGVESINGSCRRNSALGIFLNLKALYDSGETVTVYAEGGVSTIPYGWCGTDGFVDFFLRQMESEIMLTAPLYACDYTRKDTATGDFCQLGLCVETDKGSGGAVFHKRWREGKDAETREKEIFLPQENLESLERLIASLGLMDWKDLPPCEAGAAGRERRFVSIRYLDGREANLSIAQALSPEAEAALESLWQFMEALAGEA